MTYPPADLLGVQRYVRQVTGLPWASLGITHQTPQGGGYHEGHDLLHEALVAPEDPGGDYSYTESDRDRRGLTDAASAFDLGDFDVVYKGRRVTHLDVIGRVLVGVAAGDPRLADLREMIYSTDNVNVKRWDRLKRRSSGDSSHLSHTHFSWFRDSEGRRGLFLDFLVEVFEGRSRPMLEETVPQSGSRPAGIVLSDLWNEEHVGHSGYVATDKSYRTVLLDRVDANLRALLDRPTAAVTVDMDALAQAIAVKLAPLLPTAAEIARETLDEDHRRTAG